MLLKTRFYLPPLRNESVIRRPLLDVLKQSTGGALIVVSAPAGYGKTTLISQWLHLHPHTFAWLTLGTEHNQPGRFWEYVITALHQVQPEIDVTAIEHAARQTDADLVPVLVKLLNDLDRLSVDNRTREPMTLVWDDFHLVKDPHVLHLCNLLLDHLPSSLRIVVTAREAPLLALGRRRANGQLLQLGIDDLRFSEEESQRFFQHTMALTLPPQLTASLCGQTEGWIAGLQLAALSLAALPLQRKPALPPGEAVNRHIADYLLEEVFVGLSANVRTFLLHAAIPRRFCAALMNTMLACTGMQEMLVTLDNNHLFLVALDNHRTWFRFHDLFRQFLLQRLSLDNTVDIATSARSAILWFENNGYNDDAIELSLETQRISHLPTRYREAEFPPRSPHPSATVTDIPEPLTVQEKRVLELISRGLPNKAIADTLHISANTLKVHIRNLYGKMGVESRTQAMLKMKSP